MASYHHAVGAKRRAEFVGEGLAMQREDGVDIAHLRGANVDL